MCNFQNMNAKVLKRPELAGNLFPLKVNRSLAFSFPKFIGKPQPTCLLDMPDASGAFHKLKAESLM